METVKTLEGGQKPVMELSTLLLSPVETRDEVWPLALSLALTYRLGPGSFSLAPRSSWTLGSPRLPEACQPHSQLPARQWGSLRQAGPKTVSPWKATTYPAFAESDHREVILSLWLGFSEPLGQMALCFEALQCCGIPRGVCSVPGTCMGTHH